jgi:hypothetical protein
MPEQIQQQAERRRHHRFIAHLSTTLSERPHYIYICLCGYAEAIPIAGGPPHALDADFKPHPDADGMLAHLDLVRAHEMN